MNRPATTAFTLIEMLTVIVIVGIILAVGIPAFTNLMKSGGLSAASRQVANTLTMARQYAITKRTNVRVVFPYDGTTGTSGTNLAPWYQSYAVLEYGATTNYLTKWEHLPLGTVFMSDTPSPPLAPPLPYNFNNDLASTSFPFPYTNSPNATLAYIEFRPTGAASKPGTFTITEGFVSGGIVTPTSKTSSNTLANAAVISVDNVVGRIRVARP
jgi:prepilin-type N-terminal cleavage/methylation domain-containing protein